MVFGVLTVGALAAEYGEIETTSAFRTTPMVATSGAHTVTLRNDGTVWTWGDNTFGQLGDGTSGDFDSSGFPLSPHFRSTPVQVQNLNNIIAVSAGYSHTVALRNDGTVWAWGDNRFGGLGIGTSRPGGFPILPYYRSTPVQVQNLNNVTAIAAGLDYTVALRNDGTVWAWGYNWAGQLGDGTTTNRSTPVQVQNLSNVTAITTGNEFAVALRNDGTVWGWGHNRWGQFGDGTTTNRTAPVQVSSLNNVTAIAAANHIVALRNDGTVWSLGDNFGGQLGDGTTTNRPTPVQARNLNNVTAISAGGIRTVALRNDGTVWAWGGHWVGVTQGSPIRQTTPAQVQNLSNITAVAAAGQVVLRNDGTVWTWGPNTTGQLGNGSGGWGTYSRTYVQVRGVGGQGFLNLGTAPVGNTPFADVRFSDWFHDAVVHVYGRDIMRGTSATAFSPNDTLTRAMVATILYRMAGEPPTSFRQAFSDVPAGQWYSVPVTWANDAGIVQGVGGGRFSPNDRLTREQLSAMMHRYAVSRGYDVSVPANVTAPAGTSGWAMEYVRWAVHNNFILTGSPGTHATRAETANFVFRFDVRYGR